MRKISSFLSLVIAILVFLPASASASAFDIPNIFKFVDNTYSTSIPLIRSLKDQKRGSYLPGVFDSKVLSFDAVSANAKAEIKKKQEEERRKRLAEQMRLGGAEAYYDGKYIDIDLRNQTLTAFQDRSPVYRFKISSGKWAMPTPTGTFSILNKTRRAYSSKYNLYMPYWMAFTGQGHGIHELPEWPGGAKEGAGHLGIPVSHGCVRLGIGPAATIYNWTSVGDRVYAHK